MTELLLKLLPVSDSVLLWKPPLLTQELDGWVLQIPIILHDLYYQVSNILRIQFAVTVGWMRSFDSSYLSRRRWHDDNDVMMTILFGSPLKI